MAAPNFLIMEAANLFCGDHDPQASKHLTLSELQLPNLQEAFQDHHPGGSPVGIEVAVGVQKLEATFKLAGTDASLMTQFGIGSRYKKTYTAYSVLRDQRTGEAVEQKAIMQARLGKVEGEAFKRGEMQSHDYALNAITHYELWVGGKEVFYWDFFTAEYRLDGVSQNDDERNILRLS